MHYGIAHTPMSLDKAIEEFNEVKKIIICSNLSESEAYLGTIGGALSILNLGLGDATLRYVAFYHSIGNKKAVNSTFNATLWLYTILGGLVTFLFLLFPNILIKFFIKLF